MFAGILLRHVDTDALQNIVVIVVFVLVPAFVVVIRVANGTLVVLVVVLVTWTDEKKRGKAVHELMAIGNA
jgi:hypothetical protein